MGFSWGGYVHVEFGVRVKVPRSVYRFVKRLTHFRPVEPTLFASAAKTLADVGSLDAIPEQIAKRAREEARPLPADDDGASIFSNASSEHRAFSDVPSDMDDDEKNVYKSIADHCRSDYHPDGSCDLVMECYGTNIVNDAFQVAAKKLFGTNCGLEIVYEDYAGAHGECHEDAYEKALWIRAKDLVVKHEGCVDVPRGGMSGVPWGVAMTPIPLDVDVKQLKTQMEKVIDAFGLTAEEAIGWRLVSHTSGG